MTSIDENSQRVLRCRIFLVYFVVNLLYLGLNKCFYVRTFILMLYPHYRYKFTYRYVGIYTVCFVNLCIFVFVCIS